VLVAREEDAVATYVLIHGAGDVGWYWHLVTAELERRGHTAFAPDLPVDDDSAGLEDYADAAVAVVLPADSISQPVIVVAQSFGGFTAPLVAQRLAASLIVLVAAMVPKPGESASEMFEATGFEPVPNDDSSDVAVFYHDVPRLLAEAAMARGRTQADRSALEPFPLDAWPDIPTRALIAADDRFFDPGWVERVTRDRLGIEPDFIASGHCVALAHPLELVERLEGYRGALAD
jgi:Alpha/beta hydrolase family